MGGFQGSIDDDLQNLTVPGFDGGLQTELNPLRLQANQSPFLQNISLTQTGRLLGRDGSKTLTSAFTADADGIFSWFDSTGARRQLEWSGGNLYETTSGAPVLRQAACYTVTTPTYICHADFQGDVYWSDGTNFRKFNALTNVDALVVLAGAHPANLTTIGFTCMTVYAGSIVGCNCLADGVSEPHNMRWSNVNDPTTWSASNAQAVAYGTGGHIAAIANMGISASGVSPTRSLVVLKSTYGVFAYKGALGTLEEAILNIPCGIYDPETLQFIDRTTREGDEQTRAYVTFLGTDRQVWWTDGINQGRLSDDIRGALSTSIINALINNPAQRFTSVKWTRDRQYILDLGSGQQYIYQYDLGVWSFYQGLPSGMWSAFYDASGLPAIYCASRDGTHRLVNCLASNYADDDGSIIQMYYKSPFLHMNQEDVLKVIHWLYVTYVTDHGQVEATVTTNFGQSLPGSTFTFAPDTSSPNIFTLDSSLLDGPDVLTTIGAGTGLKVYEQKVRCIVPVPAYGDLDVVEPAQGVNIQIQLAQTTKSGHFEIWSWQLDYMLRGRRRGVHPQ